MATGGEWQALTCSEAWGKSVAWAKWWSMTSVVAEVSSTTGGDAREPWSRTKMYDGLRSSISFLSDSEWMPQPFCTR